MARKLARNVHVGGRVFSAGDTPDEEFAEQITNPNAWNDKAEEGGSAEVERPSGNAALEEWQTYAKSQGASDADLDGLSRNEVRDLYAE